MSRILTGLVIALVSITMASSLVTAQDVAPFIKQGSMESILYASGGVSIEERRVMEGMARDYNLKLVFAAAEGAYLSNLMVVIQDSAGNMLIQIASNGPWFFAKLPQGQYNISVALEDQRKVREVSIGEGLQTVLFHWKS